MKHYWINMDKSVDRRRYMERQFFEHSIENYRISAETPETIKSNDYTIIRNAESMETTTPEEIACILSHLKAIQQGYDDGTDGDDDGTDGDDDGTDGDGTDGADSYFCVLEDDVSFINIDFNKIIKYIAEVEAKNKSGSRSDGDGGDVEILQLYTSSHPVVIRLYNEHFLNGGNVIIKRTESYPGAVYYLVSRKAARKILDAYVVSKHTHKYDLSYSSWTAADNIIYAPVSSYVITYPVAITDIAFGSTLHPEHLPNHEQCNNIIRHIWNVNNQLSMFSR
jgi:GR25 family glycosyltransferase involved in LPS biosynthesis